jgi:hypothetical protein
MKRLVHISALAYAIFILSISAACSQNKEEKNAKNQPKVDVKVNKQYDDKGNVIGYDSTYSFSYSDTTGSPANDSIFSKFFNFPQGNFQGFFRVSIKIWGVK